MNRQRPHQEFQTRTKVFSPRRSAVIFAPVVAICLFLAQIAAADWKSDANANIEQIRKRDAAITVLGSGGQAVSDVSVQIEQIKHRFAFGTAINNGQMSNNTYKNFILKHYEWGVCENESKWPTNEPSQGSVTYSAADNIYNWCNSNGIKMRGHCLSWDVTSNVQSWVQSLSYATYPTSSALLNAVNSRINSAVNHFKGKFKHWDVCNEMLSGSFYDRLGDAGRAHMFQAANAADPDCLMFVNEYASLSFGNYNTSDYINLIQTLQGLGAPVEAIGLQGHVSAGFDRQQTWDGLNNLATLGLPIWFTEADTSNSDDTGRANDVEDLYRIAFGHPAVDGILMWGFMQGTTWRPNWWIVSSSGTLNTAGTRYESLLNAWTTKTSGTTGSDGKVNYRGFHGTYKLTLSKSGQTTEVKQIELEPGGSAQQFTLQTNFTGGGGTVPGQASSPSPANGATSVGVTTDISWTAGSGATSHDVYFGTTSPGTLRGNQTATTYDTGTMTAGTTYYWRIDEKNSYGTTTGAVWSFTTAAAGTPPGQASSPTPANGATSVGTTTDLSWTAGSGATSRDVYFGTANPPPLVSSNQTGTTYDTGTMGSGTTYYWRINEKNSYGTTTGTVWSFTTAAAGSSVSLLGSWVTGTSHTKESGSNRALILIAHAESTSTMNLSALSYGGQAMTKVVEYNYNAASGYAYAAAFILKETGVAAASSSTFSVTWSGTAPGAAGYSSVFLANVNQTTATGATGSGGKTSNPVTTSSSLATSSGDMVILGATCGNSGSYTLNNSFIEGNDQQISGTVTGVTGRKSATGANETPSATYSSTINRQMIIGLVVKHQ